MLKRLESYFKNTEAKAIYSQICLFGWLADLGNMYYVQKVLLPRMLHPEKIKTLMIAQGADRSLLTRDTIEQIQMLMISSLGTMLICFAILHTVFYFFVHKRKIGMMKYIKNYSFTAFILTLLTIPTILQDTGLWVIFTLSTIAVYFFNYRALKHLLNTSRT